MSILRSLQRGLEHRGADPRAEWGDSTPPPNGMLAGPAAGVSVTEKTALSVAAVYGSVGVIADGLATLPIELWSDTDPARRRLLPPTQLLTQPYVEISLIDWLVQYAMSMALRGNFYGHIIERDADGYATQIKPIHPDQVRVRRRRDGLPEYTFGGQLVNVDDVFHVRYLSVPGALVGLNPIEYLRLTLGLARAQDLYGGAFFNNSSMPLGVIEVEGDLDTDDTVKLARAWMSAHQGINQAHLPAVLTGGAKFNPISVNPHDAQFLESRQFSQGEISGMIFRVPPHMIGIVDRSTSWGTGIAQQEQGFVTNTLGGYLWRLEGAFKAMHRPAQHPRFDVNQRLRGDKLQRYQAYALGIAGGWLCPDEPRAEEMLPPIPDGLGKTFLAPINAQTLLAAVEATKPPPEPRPTDDQGGRNG